MQLTYPGENHPLGDNSKNETFVNGIRNPDIKQAVCSAQKTTFAEAVAFEIARMISTPQVSKARRMEVVKEKETFCINLERYRSKFWGKSDKRSSLSVSTVEKAVMFQRNWKAPRRRPRSVSPTNGRQTYAAESPLNYEKRTSTEEQVLFPTKPSKKSRSAATIEVGRKF